MLAKLLDIEEASRFLGISRNTLYSWTSSKKITHIKLGGRLRFSEQALQEWLEQHTVASIERR